MNTNSCLIQVGGIEVLLVRKPIKNVHLSVLPPTGKVRVSAPSHMGEDAIKVLLATRIPWINKQRSKFKLQDRQTSRKYLSGESHYFLGKRYRLEVRYLNQPPSVSLNPKNLMILQARPQSGLQKREQIIMDWYRSQLRGLLSELVPAWEKKLNVRASAWGIKRMKTRWGTCNHKAGRVWLNLELAKKPISHIEYVVVHELIHLIEKKHNQRFLDIMGKHLPHWRSMKDDLNRFILSYENWSY